MEIQQLPQIFVKISLNLSYSHENVCSDCLGVMANEL